MAKICVGFCIILFFMGIIYLLLILLGLIFITFNNIFSPMSFIDYNYENIMEYYGHGFILIFVLVTIIGFSYLIGNAIF